MRYSTSFLSLVAALPTVRGVAFPGPAPTAANLGRAQQETLPEPTNAPSSEELKKRQLNVDPETCGWVDGAYSLGVTCPGSRTCMLYTSAPFGMAGCCEGSDVQNCGWASSCVDARAYTSGGCGTGCLLNSFIRKCTEATAPYCVTWSYAENRIYDYGCAANSDSSISTIFWTATDAFGATTSMTLPTVVANAINTNVPYGDTTYKTARRLAIGVIVGIVVVALFVLFCIAIAILFCVKKKKKQRQIAASAQAMAAVHATRPQSEYPPPQQSQYPVPQQQQAPMQTQVQQQPPFHSSSGPQSPVPTTTPSHFAQGIHEEKPNAHTSVHEYVMTPISSPSTPAPVYSQPHGVSPPVPVVSPYQAAPGAHEVDAVSVPHAPTQGRPVHEIGHGK